MRAAVLSEIGSLPGVADIPEPADGTVVDVLAVSLNPLDLTVASGRFALGHPTLPYVIGHEAVVRSQGHLFYVAGAGVGLTKDGLAAERRSVDPQTMVALPDGSDAAVAASLGTSGVAGWMSVAMRADLQKGETVAVRGASGAAGKIALQAARARGAGKIIAVGREGSRLESVSGLCDALVADGEGVAQRITEAAGGPVDALVDFAWGPTASQAWTAVVPDGRVVVAGGAAGVIAEVASPLMLSRRLNVLGYSNFGLKPEQFAEALLTVVKLASRGDLRVDIVTVPLDDIAEAWTGTRDSRGKYVIDIQEGVTA